MQVITLLGEADPLNDNDDGSTGSSRSDDDGSTGHNHYDGSASSTAPAARHHHDRRSTPARARSGARRLWRRPRAPGGLDKGRRV